jgi:hypothetical protein
MLTRVSYRDVVLHSTNAGHGQIIPHNTNALGLDSCSLFILSATPQCLLQVKSLLGRIIRRSDTGLLNICNSLIFATLATLHATQSARIVARARKLLRQVCKVLLGSVDVDATLDVAEASFVVLLRVARGGIVN